MQSSERASKLFGVMVIALEEGLRLGRVSDVYIDLKAKQIMGISYKPGLWGTDKEIYVKLEDIYKFSRDVVIVSGMAVGMELPQEAAQCSLRTLKGYNISSAAGKHIAVLADFVINREDGEIMEILVPGNRVLQIDIGDVQIGPDLIVVPADFEPAFVDKVPEQHDLVTRILGNATLSETIRESLEGVKTSMRSTENREKVWLALRTGSLKARDTVSRTTEAIQQAIDQMMKKREPQKSETQQATEVGIPVDKQAAEAGDRPPGTDASGPESQPEAEHFQKPKDDAQT